MEQKHGLETGKALATIPKHGQLTQPEAEHILSLVYPGCPKEEIIRCAILCRDFGLHPLMKEVYLIPFKEKNGKENYVTVLGINATRKLMAQRGTYSYFDDTPRLMTPEEQKRIFGEVDNKNMVAITKLRTKDGLEAPGYGRWPNDKQPYGTDKGNTKANMAFIRSERNAFGRLSPDALPPGVDIVDEAYTELPDIDKMSGKTGKKVNTITGEIVEGEFKDVAPEPELEQKPEVHRCAEHDCKFTMKVKFGKEYWSHPLPGGKWCNEGKEKKATKSTAEPEPEPLPEPLEPTAEAEQNPSLGIDMDWLKESLKKVKFDEKTAATWITSHFGVEGGLLKDVLPKLTKEQLAEFVKEIQDRLEMA